MGRIFDDVLNECLDRIAGGEEIEVCAARYPDFRDELVPLLRVAWATMRAASSVTYRPQAKMHGLTRLAHAYNEGRMHRKRRWPAQVLRPIARPLAVGLAVVLVTAVAAGGTTVAAAGSVPGDPLYWVKTTRENLELRMARSDVEKVEVHLQLANHRSYEIQRLASEGKYSEAERLIEKLRHHLRESAAYAGVPVASDRLEMPRTAAHIQQLRNTLSMRESLERDGEMLRQALAQQMDEVPPAHRDEIQRIIRQSEFSYQMLLQALADQGPGVHKPQLVNRSTPRSR